MNIFKKEIMVSLTEAEKETAYALELAAKAEALIAEAERLKAESAAHAERASKHKSDADFYKEMDELIKKEEEAKPVRKAKQVHTRTIVMPKISMGHLFILSGMGEIT